MCLNNERYNENTIICYNAANIGKSWMQWPRDLDYLIEIYGYPIYCVFVHNVRFLRYARFENSHLRK